MANAVDPLVAVQAETSRLCTQRRRETASAATCFNGSRCNGSGTSSGREAKAAAAGGEGKRVVARAEATCGPQDTSKPPHTHRHTRSVHAADTGPQPASPRLIIRQQQSNQVAKDRQMRFCSSPHRSHCPFGRPNRGNGFSARERAKGCRVSSAPCPLGRLPRSSVRRRRRRCFYTASLTESSV